MGHLAEVRMPENCTPDGCPTGLSDTAGGGLTAFSRFKAEEIPTSHSRHPQGGTHLHISSESTSSPNG